MRNDNDDDNDDDCFYIALFFHPVSSERRLRRCPLQNLFVSLL